MVREDRNELSNYWTARLHEAERQLETSQSRKTRTGLRRLIRHYRSLKRMCAAQPFDPRAAND